LVLENWKNIVLKNKQRD